VVKLYYGSLSPIRQIYGDKWKVQEICDDTGMPRGFSTDMVFDTEEGAQAFCDRIIIKDSNING